MGCRLKQTIAGAGAARAEGHRGHRRGTGPRAGCREVRGNMETEWGRQVPHWGWGGEPRTGWVRMEGPRPVGVGWEGVLGRGTESARCAAGRRPDGWGARCPRAGGRRRSRCGAATPPPPRAGGGAGRGQRRISALSIRLLRLALASAPAPRDVRAAQSSPSRAPRRLCPPRAPRQRRPHARRPPGPRRPIRAAAAAAAAPTAALRPRGSARRIRSP